MSIQGELNITLTCDKCGNSDYKSHDATYGDIAELVEDTMCYYEWKYIKYELLCPECQGKI